MHDRAVSQDGVYDRAVKAIKAAKSRGFRVSINCTLFDGADPERVAKFFDDAMAIGIDGIMTSPGYAYERAPDQQHFLTRQKTKQMFRDIFARGKAGKTGSSRRRRCSWISSPATRTIAARRGATRRATCSAGSGLATCSVKAMPRPSPN